MKLVSCKILQNTSLMFLAALGALLLPPRTAFAAPTGYQNAVLADSPYVYYRFGEASGTTAIDASTNGFNGTYVNGPILGVPGDNAGGSSDTAATFVGAQSQYCMVATNSEAFGSYVGNSSYEFVYATTATNYGMMMLGGANAGSAVTFQIFLNENLAGSGWQTNTSRLYIRDSGGRAYGAVFTNAALLDGNFHHLVWTFTTNNATAAAYLDGVPQTLAISTGTPVTFGTLVYPIDFAAYSNKGNNTGPIDYTTATLDEGAIYPYVLTPQQVINHYLALLEPAFASEVITNLMSPIVSYQYPNDLSSESLTNGGVMSPIASYQYFEWPGNGILNLQTSPVASYYYQFIETGIPAMLQGQATSGNFILSWPLSWPFATQNFSLQTTTNLADPSSWVTLTNVPALVNLQNTITDPMVNSLGFYRLIPSQ